MPEGPLCQTLGWAHTLSLLRSLVRCGTGGACAAEAALCPTLSGTLVRPLVFGVASFTDLVISTCNDASSVSCVSGAYHLSYSAQAPGWPFLPSSPSTYTSTAVTVSVGPAVRLVYTTEPANPGAGQAFGQQPAVRVTDLGGNTVPSFNGELAVSLNNQFGRVCCASSSSCPFCSSTTIGPSTLTVSSGVASSSGLGVNTAGTAYRLCCSLRRASPCFLPRST